MIDQESKGTKIMFHHILISSVFQPGMHIPWWLIFLGALIHFYKKQDISASWFFLKAKTVDKRKPHERSVCF